MSKVLIIDDSIFNIRVLEDILKEEYEVISTRKAEEGLELAIKNRPDIILLDIEMPGMDGFEVLRNIKEQRETKDIPVVFLTGLIDPVYEERGFLCGAVDYITKPYNRNVVKVRVQTHINLYEYRKQVEAQLNLDTLTEIYNRRGLEKYMNDIAAEACREKFRVNCFILDIDFFKLVNDTYGHLQGDHVLKKVASILKQCVLVAGGYLARYGGEEFAIVLPRAEEEEIRQFIEQIFEAVRKEGIPNEKSEVCPYLTVSIGGSGGFLEKEKDIKTLLMEADEMLYKSKREGRNRFTMKEE